MDRLGIEPGGPGYQYTPRGHCLGQGGQGSLLQCGVGYCSVVWCGVLQCGVVTCYVVPYRVCGVVSRISQQSYCLPSTPGEARPPSTPSYHCRTRGLWLDIPGAFIS